MEGWRQRRLGANSRDSQEDERRKIDLTHTGLLMEGIGPGLLLTNITDNLRWGLFLLALPYNSHMHAYSFAPRMTLRRTVLVRALSTVVIGVSIAQGQGTAPAREQTVFHEYEPFQHAVPLPPQVLHALLRTKEVKEALESAREDQRNTGCSSIRYWSMRSRLR